LVLGFGKVIEPQANLARVVLKVGKKAASPAISDLTGDYLALQDMGFSRTARANRRYLGSIFVSERQMKKNILNCLDTDFGQFLGKGGADTLKAGDINVGQVARHDRVS